jgi:hypothetical protein
VYDKFGAAPRGIAISNNVMRQARAIADKRRPKPKAANKQARETGKPVEKK